VPNFQLDLQKVRATRKTTLGNILVSEPMNPIAANVPLALAAL
jgi:hypothetical protein